MSKNKSLRVDNVGIVVRDLKAAIAFYTELGLELEGQMTVEGQWVDRVVGLNGVQSNIAMMRAPGGQGKLELMQYREPAATAADLNVPVNAFGTRRVMFNVQNIDDLAARLQKLGAQLMGEMMQYGDAYRLCYLRGPDGIIVALAEDLGSTQATDVKPAKPDVRLDNVLIVVDDLEAAKSFFSEIGLELQGETIVEGPSVGNLIGLKDVRATLALMRTPDGNCGIELDKFHTPEAVRVGPVDAPVNMPGLHRVMVAVEDIDDVVARLLAGGSKLIGEVVNYENMYRLCYVRGPEGIIVALAEEVGR